MGFRVSWIARKGMAGTDLLKDTGLRTTGERDDGLNEGLYLLEIPPGKAGPWSMLIADGSEYYEAIEEQDAQSLSSGGQEVLFFWCSDTAMTSELLFFKGGQLVWAISYSPEDEERRPLVEGSVPTITHALLSELREEQRQSEQAGENVDHLYDITAAVGSA